MIIEKYGITLTRLKKNDIELVRTKRNSEDIRNSMHFQKIITPEMQLEWFNSINNIYSNYFIIEYNNQKIGLVNGKNSDYVKRQSEGGMFIWDQNYWGTFIPALCSIMMSDFTFLINEFDKNYIKVLKSNKNSIIYNKQLGYIFTDDYPLDTDTHWFVLTKDAYLSKIKKIRKGIKNITGDEEPLTIKNISFSDDTDKDFELLYKPLPGYLKNVVNTILQKENYSLI